MVRGYQPSFIAQFVALKVIDNDEYDVPEDNKRWNVKFVLRILLRADYLNTASVKSWVEV